ncbi:MAG: flavodoxin-like domain-containing protein [Candidatus Bathyarchaeota archaeon]|nr:MAG: flavodoxin-like domain-containing protein [Candidatus Bathyarchaeota archaeon]
MANALARGMEKQGLKVDCIKVDKIDIHTLVEYDFLAIGGPTHGFGISKPIKEFLQKLEQVELKDKKAFAFDTKFSSRFAGSAGKGIEKKLKKLGMHIIKQHSSAIVKGGEGPLVAGMEERFTQIGTEITKLL